MGVMAIAGLIISTLPQHKVRQESSPYIDIGVKNLG
jgi:hypothetical protein